MVLAWILISVWLLCYLQSLSLLSINVLMFVNSFKTVLMGLLAKEFTVHTSLITCSYL